MTNVLLFFKCLGSQTKIKSKLNQLLEVEIACLKPRNFKIGKYRHISFVFLPFHFSLKKFLGELSKIPFPVLVNFLKLIFAEILFSVLSFLIRWIVKQKYTK